MYDEEGNYIPPKLRTINCKCGTIIEFYASDGEPSCSNCGANYNVFGQRLREDWRGNPSVYDDDISDLDGYEMQHAGDY